MARNSASARGALTSKFSLDSNLAFWQHAFFLLSSFVLTPGVSMGNLAHIRPSFYLPQSTMHFTQFTADEAFATSLRSSRFRPPIQQPACSFLVQAVRGAGDRKSAHVGHNLHRRRFAADRLQAVRYALSIPGSLYSSACCATCSD